MGHHRPRSKPIFFLSLPLSNYNQRRGPITFVPYGPSLGKGCSELDHIWRPPQSWPVYNQRTRPRHYHGNSRIPISLCGVHCSAYCKFLLIRHIDGYRGGSESLLSPDFRFQLLVYSTHQSLSFSHFHFPRSMDDGHVNPDDRLLPGRHHAPLLGTASFHEYTLFLPLMTVPRSL